MTIIPGDDVEACADFIRPFLALYAGGMGARGANFHFEVFARMGYEDVATKVQELYLEGKKQEAAAAIPLEMVEDVALVGPPDKIRDELARWRETCLTTILVGGPASHARHARRTRSPAERQSQHESRQPQPEHLKWACSGRSSPSHNGQPLNVPSGDRQAPRRRAVACLSRSPGSVTAMVRVSRNRFMSAVDHSDNLTDGSRNVFGH